MASVLISFICAHVSVGLLDQSVGLLDQGVGLLDQGVGPLDRAAKTALLTAVRLVVRCNCI